MPEKRRFSTQKVTSPPLEEFDLQEPNQPDFNQDFDADFLDVFLPDDDPEPLPECGDFWIERD